MEDYKVLECLGKGPQGSAYLVEHREEGEKYVLKQIECKDEREAHKACKQVMELKGLRHNNVCKYMDSFLSWDSEVEAMLVCNVTEYYAFGDLSNALCTQRGYGQPIEEPVAKRWLGQLIEALHFVHERNFVHGNIKPSNVFIKDDLSLSLGDFGVPVLMDDLRALTPRATVRGRKWTAPEVLEAKSPCYDDRSDVWSLGCTVLEMVTCGSPDQGQMNRVLFQIRKDPQVLEDTMEEIAKVYSKELCQLLRSLLRRAYHQHPTTRCVYVVCVCVCIHACVALCCGVSAGVSPSELVKEPFVQECLSLSDSPLCEAKERGEEAPINAPMCPRNGNLEEVLVYIEEHADSKCSQFDALRYLSQLVKNQDSTVTLGDGGKELVLGVMTRFATSLDIQLSGVEVLATAASQDDLLSSEEGVTPLCQAIRSHPKSLQLQVQALSLLASLVCDGAGADAVGKIGGIQDILSSLRSFPLNADIGGSCCVALWSLSLGETNRKLIGLHKGVVDLCQTLERHMAAPNIVDAALSALWSLSVDDDNVSVMSSGGAVQMVLTALQTYKKEASIVNFGLLLLTSLVNHDEVTAFQVVCTDSGCEGVPIILDTMRCYVCDAKVTEQALVLLQACSGYPDIRDELVSRKAVDVLCCVQAEHAANKDVATLVEAVASQLTLA